VLQCVLQCGDSVYTPDISLLTRQVECGVAVCVVVCVAEGVAECVAECVAVCVAVWCLGVHP